MKAYARMLLAVGAAALASAPVFAEPHGGHGGDGGHGLGLGLHFGVPFAWHDPYYYHPPPYYYPPAVVAAPAAPPVYVERGDAQPEQSWWYYCPQSGAYYPYAKTCPGGWQRVSPTPPSQ